MARALFEEYISRLRARGYVIKVINEYDAYKRRMNEDDFETAKRYPFIFPKAYAHADDFSWIVMEETPPLIYPEDMQRVLDQSFPRGTRGAIECSVDGREGQWFWWRRGRLVGPVEPCRSIPYYEDDYGIFSGW